MHGERFVSLTDIKVLVVEDENEIREFLVEQLNKMGYKVKGLSDGEQVRESLKSETPDVLIIDQIMPRKTGTEVIRELRASNDHRDLPIIMLTGLDGEAEMIAALEIGADDYMTKPFSIKEVYTRIMALHRRSVQNSKNKDNGLELRDLRIDLRSHKVFLADSEVHLTLTEYRILVELLRNLGSVLSRDSLREQALGNLNVTDRTIDVHMAALRKKLGPIGDLIETVRGVGYRAEDR